MPNILLDRDESADPIHGYRIVKTEIDLLDYALSEQDLLIRGYSLCEWAESFYKGRGVTCASAPSVVRDLMHTYGSMSYEHAQFIAVKLSTSKIKIADYSPQEILGAFFSTYLWDSPASEKHAADWLLWLDEKEPPESFQSILLPLVYEWKKDKPELSDIYNSTTPESARIILEKWLGANITPFIDKFGEFPTSVSNKWVSKLTDYWVSTMIKTQGAFFGIFIKAHTLRQLKQAIARVALDYFEENPEFVTIEICNQIVRFVSGKDAERASALQPVPEPSQVPTDPDAVIDWFVTEYLPYKSWCLNTGINAGHDRGLELGRKFAEWYLDFYPKALNSKKHISFFQSQNLRSAHPKSINLLVVLDGLHYLDAKFLMNALLNGKDAHRLGMIENSLCFAPVPTVTEFTKGALVRGVQPSLTKEIEILGEDVSEQETPTKKIKLAQPGDLVIWRIQEPDNTYHKKNKNSTLLMEIEGQLTTQVKKILDVIDQIPLSVDVNLFVTTDHGRYLGVSQRVVAVPEEMEAHGRAAWGNTNLEFPKSGYVIKDNIAYLSRHRYGFENRECDVAVILDDNAFQDKTYKQEKYPHGGLFPEEVIIPWMVFTRNVEKPKVEMSISGDGAANQPGKLLLTAVNSSRMNLSIVKCEFDFGPDKKVLINKKITLPSLKEIKIEIDIPAWPSSEQLQIAKSCIVLALPSEDEFEKYISLSAVKVNELYTRDKSLLEGLDI
jgi:hypothetical protein